MTLFVYLPTSLFIYHKHGKIHWSVFLFSFFVSLFFFAKTCIWLHWYNRLLVYLCIMKWGKCIEACLILFGKTCLWFHLYVYLLVSLCIKTGENIRACFVIFVTSCTWVHLYILQLIDFRDIFKTTYKNWHSLLGKMINTL